MAKSCQEGGIVFGNWKLFPLDGMNWELCHRHETADTESARKSGSAGTLRWHRLGRYYQASTFEGAILYAADVELKGRCKDVAIQLEDALREHERIVKLMLDEFSSAMEGVTR